MSRNRSWVFTVNNYDELDLDNLRHLPDRLQVRYLVFGREVGENGTPHLQGMVTFLNPWRLSGLKEQVHAFAHWELMRGSFKQAAEYCKKDGDFEEFGECPADRGEEQKMLWEDIRAKAQAGDIDSIPADVYVRYYSTLKRIARDHMSRPADLESGACGIWIYGFTECGKSRFARHHWPVFYHKMPNKWWDGYQGEETVFVEDVDPSHDYLAYHLKIWMDRYGFPCENKGGSVQIRPARVVVTSQYTIEQVFLRPDDAAAVRRRCHVIHLAANGVPWVPPTVPGVPCSPSCRYCIQSSSSSQTDIDFLA